MIYRCNHCGLVAEEVNIAAGNKIPCQRCQTPSTVYPTVFYVEKILERYIAALREIKALKENEKEKDSINKNPENRDNHENNKNKDYLPVDDIYNTTILTKPEQHKPLQEWFKKKQIEAHFDYEQVDTSGFFDDAACAIGDNYQIYNEIMERVAFSYRKNHSKLSIALINKSQKDGVKIHELCRTFYSYSLFANFYYNKQQKIIHLTLQNAPVIRQFFMGGWLEWYAFMTVFRQTQKSKIKASFARGVKITFQNEDLHELDVIYLPQGKTMPIVIECKTGEFRNDIEKYIRLRKRLGIEKSHFIIYSSELTEEQAKGFSAMYELSFVNLTALEAHLVNFLT